MSRSCGLINTCALHRDGLPVQTAFNVLWILCRDRKLKMAYLPGLYSVNPTCNDKLKTAHVQNIKRVEGRYIACSTPLHKLMQALAWMSLALFMKYTHTCICRHTQESCAPSAVPDQNRNGSDQVRPSSLHSWTAITVGDVCRVLCTSGHTDKVS